MRIFLLGSSGFQTRVGSPSTLAAVGMGPVLVICLRSVLGADGVVGVVAAGGCWGGVKLMTVGCTFCAVGWTSAGTGVVTGAGTGAGVTVVAGFGTGWGAITGAGAGAAAGGGEVGAAGAEMKEEAAGACSHVVVCTGCSSVGAGCGGAGASRRGR